MNHRRRISYSDTLIKFVEPILSEEDDEDQFLFKAQMGMIAWNYVLAREMNFLEYVQKSSEEAFLLAMEQSPFWESKMKKLTRRKMTTFAKYTNFLVMAEIRDKPDGSQTLYVESTPAEVMQGKVKL